MLQRRWLHTNLRKVRPFACIYHVRLKRLCRGCRRETSARRFPRSMPPLQAFQVRRYKMPGDAYAKRQLYMGSSDSSRLRPHRLGSKSRSHLVPPRRLGTESRLPKLQRSGPRRSLKTPRTLPRRWLVPDSATLFEESLCVRLFFASFLRGSVKAVVHSLGAQLVDGPEKCICGPRATESITASEYICADRASQGRGARHLGYLGKGDGLDGSGV